MIAYIKKTQELGADYFDGRASHSFGKLTRTEWNNMFAKHLDHHLGQFGVMWLALEALQIIYMLIVLCLLSFLGHKAVLVSALAY
ncbi:MAG: hypothetical protein U5K79_00455 [Cyclobacteriaceae bacterium]|nr:hypothetical protein [Cyclobacteriaceae bacterium]